MLPSPVNLRRLGGQLCHDLGQLSTDGHRNIHRTNDIGQQHRHLLELGLHFGRSRDGQSWHMASAPSGRQCLTFGIKVLPSSDSADPWTLGLNAKFGDECGAPTARSAGGQ
jgi:hypothetical protein